MTTKTHKSELKTEEQLQQENQTLSAGITLSLAIEQNFKLYSFRIINAEAFKIQNDKIISNYKTLTK